MDAIGIIGAGKMGSALLRGLTAAGRDPVNLWICDHHQQQLAALDAQHPCSDPNIVLKNANVVILAVKPQSFPLLAQSITVDCSKKLIISIMAGISRATLESALHSPSVVRSMPNLGAQIGKSLTAWIGSPALSQEERRTVRDIFTSIGQEMELPDEASIDAFTALAGSGPAYFFHMCAALTQLAQEMGFPSEQASLIGRETCITSGLLLQNNNRTAREWVTAVASKGGTTEAALAVFKEKNFDAILREAIEAARERSRQLSE